MDEGINTTEDTATRRQVQSNVTLDQEGVQSENFAEAGELRKVALPRKLKKLICVCPKRRNLR